MLIFFKVLSWVAIAGCQAYQLKQVQVPSYARPWVLVAADGVELSQLTAGRIHFHGWTQDQKTGAPYHPEFDFFWKNPLQNPSEQELRKMIDGYGVAREVEQNPDRLMMIPISRGHCDDYLELKKEGRFQQVLTQVLATAGIDSSLFKVIKMSAHSGGGDLMSRVISDEVSDVTVFDGIYGKEAADRYLQWITKKGGSLSKALTLITIPGLRPAAYSSQILTAMSGEMKLMSGVRDGIVLESKSKSDGTGSRAVWIQEKSEKNILNHWTLVRFFWLD